MPKSWTAFVGLLALSTGASAACPEPAPETRSRWAGQAQWQAIERAGLRFGKIEVQVTNVYDPDQPGQDVWYARAADYLHIPTRPWVIRQLLLIAPGEQVTAKRVYQATRRLRRQVYLRSADIVPVACSDGTVTTRVKVRDAWTLRLDARFSHAGGANQFRFNIKDTDVLGSGRSIGIGHQKTLERSEDYVEFASPTLAGTPWALAAQYARLSDGRRAMLSVTRPFQLDTTPWSSSFQLLDQKLDLNFYARGDRAWQLPARESTYKAQWQHRIYASGDTVFRLGLAARRARYSYAAPRLITPGLLPPPQANERTLVGVGPSFNLHQDRYASFTNIQSVARVEDYNMGWNLSGNLLLDSTALGSTENGPALSLDASKGWQPGPGILILANASLAGRQRSGQWRNLDLRVSTTAYGQISPRQTLVAHADYALLNRPDPENRLYIGGFQALRGYPNFYDTGSRRLRLTVADRLVSRTVLFNTFQLGYVVFVDAARVEGSTSPDWSPWYAAAGAGFRIGNLRGAYNRVLYFTVSHPLRRGPGVSNGLQVVVGNVIDF
jgi:hypothetical protein